MTITNKTNSKKIISLFLTLAILLTMMPAIGLSAFAEKSVTPVLQAGADQYIDKHGKIKEIPGGATKLDTQTTLGASGTETWYYVDTNTTVNIEKRIPVSGIVNLVLKDNSMLQFGKPNKTDFGINVPPATTLNIYAQSTGLNVGKLIISGTSLTPMVAGIGGGTNGEDCGTIGIYGGDFNLKAGIGGGYGPNGGSGGKITIINSKVNVLSEFGAGIGGGYGKNGTGGSGGKITIINSTITAKASMGAGIGGGHGLYGTGGAGGTVKIIHSEVTALSEGGAGIGGGYGASTGNNCTTIPAFGGKGSHLIINRSTVQATSTDGAGIGGGAAWNSSQLPGRTKRYAYVASGSATGGAGGTVKILHSTVKTTSEGGAGIGGGRGYSEAFGLYASGSATGGSSGTIKILSGTVEATSWYGAGIGGGQGQSSADKACSGSATGGSGKTIRITGGKVTAKCDWYGGAGIGGGQGYSESYQMCSTGTGGAGGNVTITNGEVNAYSEEDGAGIGGGAGHAQYYQMNTPATADKAIGGAGGNIKITGGKVNAVSCGAEIPYSLGAGIGGGGASINNAEFNPYTVKTLEANGTGGLGAKLIITGGTVTAKANFGAGIGGGAATGNDNKTNKGGNGNYVSILNGTVLASSDYSASIGGAPGNVQLLYIQKEGDVSFILPTIGNNRLGLNCNININKFHYTVAKYDVTHKKVGRKLKISSNIIAKEKSVLIYGNCIHNLLTYKFSKLFNLIRQFSMLPFWNGCHTRLWRR